MPKVVIPKTYTIKIQKGENFEAETLRKELMDLVNEHGLQMIKSTTV